MSNSQEDAFGAPPSLARQRFFFDRYDGAVRADAAGVELEGLEAAQDEARRVLAAMLGEARSNLLARSFVVVVRGAAGAELFKATLSLTIEPAGRVGAR
jgi:hypothetical protein